jgi:hypothetical protein
MHLWRERGGIDPVRTQLFTDRSIYRPGQTIRFKGIHFHADTKENDYRTLPDKSLTIRLRDVNGEEVGAVEVMTNARGGFSGSFTAPKGRVTGRMTIEEGNHGSTSISMEEYKRPKFEVAIEAPAQSPKLGEAVVLKGRADSYAGAPIDGAEVRWRVTREARWPGWLRWCGWFFPPANEGAKEIANGVAKTAADGSFEIPFNAEPDLTVEEKAEPSFEFSIHADVTDTAGETRSGSRSVTVGYTALKADLAAADWQTAARPVEIAVHTTSLGGEGLAASGNVSHPFTGRRAKRRMTIPIFPTRTSGRWARSCSATGSKPTPRARRNSKSSSLPGNTAPFSKPRIATDAPSPPCSRSVSSIRLQRLFRSACPIISTRRIGRLSPGNPSRRSGARDTRRAAPSSKSNIANAS